MKDLMKPYSKTPQLNTLRYPVIATPKIDGIRCAVENGKLRTYNKKPVPNRYVNQVLGQIIHFIEGFDGELIVKGTDFNGTQSGIMSEYGEPDFHFIVFDKHDSTKPYKQRIEEIALASKMLRDTGYEEAERIFNIGYELCRTAQELQYFWDSCVSLGYEGAIANSPEGFYKNGRSGLKEQLSIKLKQWHDDEAVIVEVREEISVAGEPKGRAGVLWVRHANGCEFGVAGMDDATKALYWRNRKSMPGLTVSFKYQDWPVGGNPRFPGLKGVRYDA